MLLICISDISSSILLFCIFSKITIITLVHGKWFTKILITIKRQYVNLISVRTVWSFLSYVYVISITSTITTTTTTTVVRYDMIIVFG